ncbi:MAG: penicillin-binding protein activator [Rhodospirillales bacterium]
MNRSFAFNALMCPARVAVLPATALVMLALVVLPLLGACQSSPFGGLNQGGKTSSGTPSRPVISGPRTPPPPTYAVTPVPRPAPPPLTQPEQSAQPQTTTITAPDDGKVRVALLLPLSGAGAGVGQAMLNAAQMALFSFADDNFTLLTHDTRGTPEGAAEAAQLAIGDGAGLIMGPLLAANVREAASVARQAGVPIIAFSSDRTVAGNGVYTLGFLPRAQVTRVIEFARGRGVTRFAALAPDNAYGRTVLDAFKAAVGRSGGEIARLEVYSPDADDFSAVVRDLADYEFRRQTLLDQRKELEGKEDEVSKAALARLETLQTMGDLPYDALLVADGGKRLQAIAALLPFYDIDPNKVRMLGTGQWDEPGIGAEPALVGGWYAAPPPGPRAGFEKEYKDIYGEAPPRLATIAYDAAALASVLAQLPGPDRFTAELIANANGFSGRDGIFRFLADGTSERGLAVLQVRQRDAIVIDKAPATFQAITN